jgi:O-antigen ligase
MYLGRKVSCFVVLILALSPALHVTWRFMGSGLSYLLLLLSVACMFVYRREHGALWPEWRRWLPLMLACMFLSLVILAGDVFRGMWHAASFEKSLRYTTIVPLVWLFSRIEPALLRQVQWGIVAGALWCAWLLIFPEVRAGTRPDTIQYTLYNTVGFGALTLIYACLSFISLGWDSGRIGRFGSVLKYIAGLLALYGVFCSETRTAWLAVPGLVLIAVVMLRRFALWKRVLVCATVLLVGGLVLSNSVIWQKRMDLAVTQAQECQDKPTADTSVCIRSQLWRAATEMVRANPFFGVGAGTGFSDNLQQQADDGHVAHSVARDYGEAHNDYFYMAASHGLLGLLGFALAMFVMPAIYLFSKTQVSDRAIAWAAAMGLTVVLSFVAFGTTEMMFRNMRTASFYAIWLACFLALAWGQVIAAKPKS